MKKLAVFLSVFFLFTATAGAADLEITREGRSDLSPLQRSGHVFVRGLTNALTSPLELYRTFKTERQRHPKLWPIFYLPRSAYNGTLRFASACYDVSIFPMFVVPFTDDIRPFTHYYDLPDYPWQLELDEE